MNLKVLIVDDESLSRTRLRQLLSTEPHVEIVAECADGKSALEAIRQKSPDLVFLDIKMPELDGFGVIKSLLGGRIPAIIFVTAYDQFALQAFDVHAVDFLLKPFDRGRFQTAIQRARERLRNHAEGNRQLISEALATLEAYRNRLDHFTVKSDGRIHIVKTSDIDWIGAADNYAELHVGKTSYLFRMTLHALAERLAKHQFVRISRSRLVNLSRVKEMRPKAHGDCVILMQNGARLSASRTYRRNLLELFRNS
jgi:two-component system, LytTR family, response regulator